MFEIIPAIDIIGGKCVRLNQGDYNKMKIYNDDPLEVAKSFEDLGIKRLHLVDLDGAKSGKVINYKVVENIANNTNLEVDFGGGVNSYQVFEEVLAAGAKWINLGSIVFKKPEEFNYIKEDFSEQIILSADVLDEKIKISGWLEETGVSIFDFIQNNSNINKVVCTDISKDGMLIGSSIELYKKILLRFPNLFLIASGGVSSIEEIHSLKNAGLSGAIIGKAIYENKINVNDLKEFTC